MVDSTEAWNHIRDDRLISFWYAVAPLVHVLDNTRSVRIEPLPILAAAQERYNNVLDELRREMYDELGVSKDRLLNEVEEIEEYKPVLYNEHKDIFG